MALGHFPEAGWRPWQPNWGEARGNEGREGHRAEGGLGLAKEGGTAKKMVSFFWTFQKWH